MCGITGLIDLRAAYSETELQSTISKMNTAMLHRGPDSSGVWVDPSFGLGFGHQRLSIIDLSPAGAQPMHSSCGRYVIAFNGEIYNFTAIKAELEKSGHISWKGHSDTEVLLAAIQRHGLQQALTLLEGMFAFALWDRENQTLSLVRDRLGEKPLYYGVFGSKVIFGSSLASFAEVPNVELQLDRNSLALMMRHNYIPEPYSIYKHVSKLKPGTCASFDFSHGDADQTPTISTYWSVSEAITKGKADCFSNEAEAIDHLEDTLQSVVSGAMVSDVPIGAFLSGGIDSSLITALMQANSSAKVNTFSIGFKEDAFSEAEYAKQVAQHLGTHHTELYLTGKDALDVIPSLPAMYDEPFSDSSQIPTFLVSKMARSHVTVALSGDGGDELFCGYNRYLFAENLHRKLSKVPAPLRSVITKAMRVPGIDQWDAVYGLVQKLLRRDQSLVNFGDKMYKLAEVLESSNEKELYRRLVSHWKQPSELILGSTEYPTVLNDSMGEGLSFVESMMALDTVSYLPGDILTKVDRSAMFNSLETRVPFLNHRVLECAWRMPLDFKLKGAVGKHPLREILYKHVPKHLIDRPKMGFGVPLGQWLRTDLRDWVEDLLDENSLREQGVFNVEMVRLAWRDHLSGKVNNQYYLWDVLMFQAWWQHNKARVTL